MTHGDGKGKGKAKKERRGNGWDMGMEGRQNEFGRNSGRSLWNRMVVFVRFLGFFSNYVARLVG